MEYFWIAESIYANNFGNMIIVSIKFNNPIVIYGFQKEISFKNLEELQKYLIYWKYELIGYV